MTDPARPPFPLALVRDLLRRLLGHKDPADGAADRSAGPDSDDGELDREILRTQVRVIRKALDGEVAAAGPEGTRPVEEDGETHLLYHPRRALVREDDVEAVLRFFDAARERFNGDVERIDIREIRRSRTRASTDTVGRDEHDALPRLAVLSFPERTDRADQVLATIEELEGEIREGVATPDHVLYVTIKAKLCPATEPEMIRADEPWPPVSLDESAGAEVRVGVVDTGLWTPAVTSPTTPWMDGVVADPADEETIDPTAIHPYGGHGTFVSGVVQCLAPASRVEVEGALTHGGAVYESAICQQLHEALVDNDQPQIISISAGTHTRKSMALLGFEMLAAEHGLDDGEATIVVAAAGNDGSDEPFWPAAFPWVVAVGSVDADGTVSDFSNYGRWVDVYARGRDIVNAFPVGTYTCYEPPNVGQVRSFKGLAQWSGTSFSTPIVSGLIAAEMSASSTNATTARDAVLGSGTSGTDPDGNPIRIVGPLT